MTGAIVGAVAGASLLLLGIYGWRIMVRSDMEKARVLLSSQGSPITLRIQLWKVISEMHVVFLRLDRGNVVLRDRDNEERVHLIEAVREIRQGDPVLGRW